MGSLNEIKLEKYSAAYLSAMEEVCHPLAKIRHPLAKIRHRLSAEFSALGAEFSALGAEFLALGAEFSALGAEFLPADFATLDQWGSSLSTRANEAVLSTLLAREWPTVSRPIDLLPLREVVKFVKS